MQSPLVSVFIPVYNCEDYIKESLESIINQTYKNIEIILVDDGSTDNSVKIIESYSDTRIRLIENEKNMGIPYTRNVGLKEAKGKYLVIMDSDDISVHNRIEKQVEYLEKNQDIDAVGTYYVKFGSKKDRKIKSKFISPDEVTIFLLFFNPVANPSSAIRMKTIEENNLEYNPHYFVAQDYGMWAQISKVGNIAIMPEFLLRYRFGHENITKKSKNEKAEKRKQIINSIHEDLLIYYDIHLSEIELEVYNEFFSYNYGSIRSTSILIEVINKLKKWNKNSETFQNRQFTSVLDYSVVLGLSNQKINLKYKISLYNRLINQKMLKSILYIMLKHFVNIIRDNIK